MAEERKCSCPLVPMTTSEGVTVDFCPETKAILFDPGEAAIFFELETDLPGLAKNSAVLTGRRWICPKHPNGHLVEYRFPKLDDLTLDICDEGGCILFDKGEVPRFEALPARIEAPRSRMLRVFERLRASGYRVLGVTPPNRADEDD